MNETPDKRTRQEQDFDGPIEAIDFSPVEGPIRTRRVQLKPAHVILSLALLVFVSAAWFVLTARSVFIDVTPLSSDIQLDGRLAVRIGPRYLVLPGQGELVLTAPGYYEYQGALEITREATQNYRFELLPLPGYLNLNSTPVSGATVFIDGEEVGTTPLEGIELAAGEHTVALQMERYQALTANVVMEGREQEQSLSLDMQPDWANVSFSSSPPGATVFIDEEEVGVTPLQTEVLSGRREVRLKLAAHKAWTQELNVRAREDMQLPTVELEAADGLVYLQSQPDNAGVLLNGEYQGQTPLEIVVSPNQDHELTFFSNGYQRTTRQLRLTADEEASLNVQLPPITSSVQISVTPEDAELYVNGEYKGNANQTIELLAASQELEIRREGYVSYTTDFISRPGLEQRLDISLLTLEQQRINAIEPIITTVTGQRLRLLYPATFTMGASRREAGRQANEILREVTLTKPFYIAETEVTNAQFRRFRSDHSSGVAENHTLDNSNQPVVRVSWNDAALFCNWLSEEEGLPPFYEVENGRVVGHNAGSIGYRLPTEAEWAWSARVAGDPQNLLKFPWGNDLPPPENHGNYADLSAASLLGRILSNYNDSYPVSAPVASFAANQNGLYDMGGNVAEWVHDFYGTSGQLGRNTEQDPLGPEDGNYRVIRGSSWAHGTVTDLRLSYRDYGDANRDDVGFRIARYLEE